MLPQKCTIISTTTKIKHTIALYFQELLPKKTAKYGPQIELRQNTVCSVEKFTQALKSLHNHWLRWL